MAKRKRKKSARAVFQAERTVEQVITPQCVQEEQRQSAVSAVVVALLTKQEVAEMLNLTTRTVEAWMARGLPHYKLGARRTRFDPVEVRAYLRQNCAVARTL